MVGFVQGVGSVSAARYDFAIDFDGDALLCTAGFGKQGRNRGGRGAIVGLAIEKNPHAQSVTPRVAGRYQGQCFPLLGGGCFFDFGSRLSGGRC